MRPKLKKLPAMAILLLFCSHLQAIRISISGTWLEIIDAADLEGPPGSNLRPFQESLPNQARISIRNTNRRWEINVSREDVSWPDQFKLYVRRTGEGIGPGTIQGGLTYLEILEVSQLFFSGSRQRLFIPLQFRLEGLSVEIPPGEYITTIIYRAIEY